MSVCHGRQRMERFEILSHLALSSRLSQISSIITEAVPSLLLLMYCFICPSWGSEATFNTSHDDQRSNFLFKVKRWDYDGGNQPQIIKEKLRLTDIIIVCEKSEQSCFVQNTSVHINSKALVCYNEGMIQLLLFVIMQNEIQIFQEIRHTFLFYCRAIYYDSYKAKALNFRPKLTY